MLKNRYVFLALSIAASGCVTTTIDVRPLHPKVQEVLEYNELRPIALVVRNEADRTLGHQYLFLALPLGTVTHSDVSVALQNALVTELSLSGFRPLPPGPARLTLEVALRQMQLSAYDLLVVRRLYSEVILSAVVRDANGAVLRSASAVSKDSQYRPFGFKKELSSLFDKVLREGVSNLIREAGLKP